MKVDTLDPKGNSKPTKNEFKEGVRLLGFNRLRWNDGGDPTPLPEGIAGADWLGEGVDSVEKLRDSYTNAKGKNFMDFLSDENKADPAVTKYKTADDFVKGHKNALELVGKKGVVIPEEGDPEEKWNEYHKALGVPEDSSKYSLAEIENLHPDIKMTPEETAGFTALAHKHKLNQKQADGLYQDYYGMLSKTLEKRDQDREDNRATAESKLRQEWGKDFAENSTIAKRVVQKFGGKEALAAFGDLGNNPGVLKFLSDLGKKISEDSFVGVGSVDLTVDAGGAKGRIKQIEADPDFLGEDTPRRKALLDERTRLYKIAYSD